MGLGCGAWLLQSSFFNVLMGTVKGVSTQRFQLPLYVGKFTVNRSASDTF